LKRKGGEISVEKLHVLKKDDEIYKLLREILSKERKKERRSQFPIVQNLMSGLIHTHTSKERKEITKNMTLENDVAQSTGSTKPRCGRPTMCWRISKNCFVYVSNRGRA
jgi:hypothetical protein